MLRRTVLVVTALVATVAIGATAADAPASPAAPAQGAGSRITAGCFEALAAPLSQLGEPAPPPDALDGSIRECRSYGEWLIGIRELPELGQAYPELLENALDRSRFLERRCTDAGTGLAVEAVCVDAGFGPGMAAPTSVPVATVAPSGAVPDGTYVEPDCYTAFATAASEGALKAGTPRSGLVDPDYTDIDATIRACPSYGGWLLGVREFPDLLGGVLERQALLLQRCTDATANLAETATCIDAGFGPGTAAPVLPELVRLPKNLTPPVRGATRVRTFKVRGEGGTQVLEDVLRKAKRRCDAPHGTLACVNYRWRLTWTSLGAGQSCRVIGARYKLTSTVNLPRWVGTKRVEAVDLEWWRRRIKTSAAHEAKHIAIQKKHLGALRKNLVGKRCDVAKRSIKRAYAHADRAQAAFDEREQARGFEFPPN